MAQFLNSNRCNSNTSSLNAHAMPYVKLTPYSPPSFPTYPPQYVYYHHHNTLQVLYYNTYKQPFLDKPFHIHQHHLAPKKLAPFFPRHDLVPNDNGAEKKKKSVKNVSRTFYAPRRRMLEKEKSFVARTSVGKKVTSDHVGFSRVNVGTSLMIRNIPNKFQRCDLLKILDNHCLEQNKVAKLHDYPWKSKYDFLYLPMDFKTGGNLGYAFVNFTTRIGATRFRDTFHQFKWEDPHNRKICEVTNAVIQGRDALRNHFRNSVFPCHTNDYLPVVFSPPRHGSNCPRFDLVGRRVDTSK